jgi:hypothetical protein
MENNMQQKVAIYIRTSSEAQGERASPIDRKTPRQSNNSEWIVRAFYCPLKAALPDLWTEQVKVIQ